jgi:hypothetical protein
MMAVGQEELELVFQTCLEMIQSRRETFDSVLSLYPDQAGAMRPALEALVWLQRQARFFDPRPGFVESSRRRLLARIQQEVASQRPLLKLWAALLAWFSHSKWLSLQLILILILIPGLVIGASGVIVASQSAIPGDILYPMKTAMEDTQMVLTLGSVGEARLHIGFAQHRLQEIQTLILKGKYQYISETVSEFERQASQATRLLKMAAEKGDLRVAPLAILLKDNLVNQSRMLEVLSGIVPDREKEPFSRLMATAQASISLAEDVIGTVPNAPASSPTSEAPVVATPVSWVTPTSTLPAVSTGSVPPSPVNTPLVRSFGVTASPSIAPLRHRATATLTATSTEAKPTRHTPKPTHTPRPLRTPKPTKEKPPDGSSSLLNLEAW